jgi:DNA-binding transcriptional LysR family regulator
MVDWEDLHCFTVFARYQSLSGAARELRVEHATVARRIAALEHKLMLKLVDRRARAYFLTSDGERIAEIAARMEEECFAVDRAARGGQRELTGSVSISAPPVLSARVLAPRLGELRRSHPGIALRVISETRTASLHHREADLALRLSRPTETALVARKVCSIRFWLYATPGYLATHTAAAWGFLAYDETMARSPQQQWLKAHAGDRPIILCSNDLEVQHAAARAGVGIVGLPSFAGDRDPTLVRVASDGPRLVRDAWLAVHGDLTGAPIVRAVMDFVRRCLTDALAD